MRQKGLLHIGGFGLSLLNCSGASSGVSWRLRNAPR